MKKSIDRHTYLVYYLTMTVIQKKKYSTMQMRQATGGEFFLKQQEEFMEYNSALPIYLQVAQSIKRDIVTGKLAPGDKLPSVRELAVNYTINPNTVSRVYKELETEQVCFTKRGMGTFVTEDTQRVAKMKREMAGTLIYEFLEGMKQLGFSHEEAIRILEESEYREG